MNQESIGQDILVDVRTTQKLTEPEMNRVKLALGCGALTAVFVSIKGPAHSKQKRSLVSLRDTLQKQAWTSMPGVGKKNRKLFDEYIAAGDTILKQLMKEVEHPTHVMLNLAHYCTKDLNLKQTHKDKVFCLFALFKDAFLFGSEDGSCESILKLVDNEVIAKQGVIL